MSPAALSVVADNASSPVTTELVTTEIITTGATIAQRVRRMQAEARDLAKDHVHAFTATLVEAELLAIEIAEGGDVYPPGVRDLARRLAEALDGRAQTLEAIIART